MTISKAAVSTGLGLVATVATAAGAAVSDSSVIGLTNAGISIATAMAGFLHLFGAVKAEAEARAVVSAVPTLVPVVAAVAPVVEAAVKSAEAK